MRPNTLVLLRADDRSALAQAEGSLWRALGMLVAGGALRSAVLLLRKVGMLDCAQALAQAVADALLDGKQGGADAGEYCLHGGTGHNSACMLLPGCCCFCKLMVGWEQQLGMYLTLLGPATACSSRTAKQSPARLATTPSAYLVFEIRAVQSYLELIILIHRRHR